MPRPFLHIVISLLPTPQLYLRGCTPLPNYLITNLQSQYITYRKQITPIIPHNNIILANCRVGNFAPKLKSYFFFSIKEYALEKQNTSKFKNTKMDDLVYTELEMQNHLVSGNLSTKQKKQFSLQNAYGVILRKIQTE